MSKSYSYFNEKEQKIQDEKEMEPLTRKCLTLLFNNNQSADYFHEYLTNHSVYKWSKNSEQP